jgi:hypothetical protein
MAEWSAASVTAAMPLSIAGDVKALKKLIVPLRLNVTQFGLEWSRLTGTDAAVVGLFRHYNGLVAALPSTIGSAVGLPPELVGIVAEYAPPFVPLELYSTAGAVVA